MVDILAQRLSELTGTKFIILRRRVPVKDRPGQVFAIKRKMRYGLRAERGGSPAWTHTFQAHRPMPLPEITRWLASICDMIEMGFIQIPTKEKTQ